MHINYSNESKRGLVTRLTKRNKVAFPLGLCPTWIDSLSIVAECKQSLLSKRDEWKGKQWLAFPLGLFTEFSWVWFYIGWPCRYFARLISNWKEKCTDLLTFSFLYHPYVLKNWDCIENKATSIKYEIKLFHRRGNAKYSFLLWNLTKHWHNFQIGNIFSHFIHLIFNPLMLTSATPKSFRRKHCRENIGRRNVQWNMLTTLLQTFCKIIFYYYKVILKSNLDSDNNFLRKSSKHGISRVAV